MSSVPPGKRSWKCPECGDEVLLSMTQLDPIACENCMAKLKGRPSTDRNTADVALSPGPLGIWQALPETTKLAIVAVSFVVGLLVGLAAGFLAGKAAAPQSSTSHSVTIEHEEERPDPPGPGYKWVRGRERKDGTRGSGHWAKDPFYKGDDAPASKKK